MHLSRIDWLWLGVASAVHRWRSLRADDGRRPLCHGTNLTYREPAWCLNDRHTPRKKEPRLVGDSRGPLGQDDAGLPSRTVLELLP
jgi:hypothetical protein